MNGPTLIIVIVVAFLIYRLAWRARTLTARQRVNVGAMLTRIAFLLVISALVVSVSLHQPLALVGSAVGLLLGGAVAWFGLRLTRLDQQVNGLYYTPNKYLGLSLFAIFLVRLIYKIIVFLPLYEQLAAHPASGGGNDSLALYASDPVTTGVYFLLIGYYIFYYCALMLRQRRALGGPTTPSAPTLGGGALDI